MLALVGGGCAGGEPCEAASAADCAPHIRVDGVTYTSHGYTERRAVEHGRADDADCHDVGCNAAGSVFPDDPWQVTTWTFRGYPPDEVLGVRFAKDSFAVFIVDSLPRRERDRLLRELRS